MLALLQKHQKLIIIGAFVIAFILLQLFLVNNGLLIGEVIAPDPGGDHTPWWP
jgi:hypothetical protein